MGFNSHFLVKNRFGVFYFQKRVPNCYLIKSPSLPKLVRLSLETKSKKDAIKLTRLILVMWDLRAKQYFKDEQNYHEGMKLFQQYLKAVTKYQSFEDISTHFFDLLDDETSSDSRLLETAANYHESIQIEKGVNPYLDEIQRLRTILGSTNGSNSTVNSVPLDEAFNEFISHHKTSWREDGTMESSYRVSYYPVLKAVVEDCKTGEITKAHINQFIKIVLNLPANKSKMEKYRDKPMLTFLTYKVLEKDKLSPTSQEKYIRRIATFLRWLRTNDYTEVELDLPIKGVKFSKTRSNEQRAGFTKSDLGKLFNSKEYTNGLHKQSAHFWVPLIGLFTGARLNEICQLRIKDIQLEPESNRWVFDINDDKSSDPNKSLKKPYHARLVPIHKKLIELGFIKFVEHQKKNKHQRLFPELPFVSNNNKYGDKLQRWFNRTYKNSCQIKTVNASFHSLRHTVITHLVNDKKIDPNRIAIGFGQTPIGGVTQTVYTKRQSAMSYYQYFDLVDFNDCFDMKQIRGWTYHLFNRPELSKNE
jgi:integrase